MLLDDISHLRRANREWLEGRGRGLKVPSYLRFDGQVGFVRRNFGNHGLKCCNSIFCVGFCCLCCFCQIDVNILLCPTLIACSSEGINYKSIKHKVRNLNIDLATVGQIIGQVLIAKEERVRLDICEKRGFSDLNRDVRVERWGTSSVSLLPSNTRVSLCKWSSHTTSALAWTGTGSSYRI